MEYAIPVGEIYLEGPYTSSQVCLRMFGNVQEMFRNV